MNYYSLNNKSPNVSFQEAVVNGLAPDKGLYFPEKALHLYQKCHFLKNIDISNNEIAFEVIKQFVGDEIPKEKLKEIIKETVDFDFPLVQIDRKYFYFRTCFTDQQWHLKMLAHVLWHVV